MKAEYAAQVAKLNDEFRKSGLGFVLTPGALQVPYLADLIEIVKRHDSFNKYNDPYGEHDFATVSWRGEKLCWKIDYYDKSLRHGINPLSSECRRVLTIMLASEY